MQQFLKTIRINKFLLLTIIVSLLSFYQLIRPGFFPMQDDLQAFRLQQMVKCLSDFQIPCRWIPDMGYQYGYPQFNFYGPTPFYFGAILNFVGIQIIDVVKILFMLGFLLSAISIFVFLKTFLNQFSAFVGGVLYTIAPFKAAEVYVRGSLNEFLVFIFLPLIFWSSYLLIETKKNKYLLWLSASLALLFTTHNLTSMIFLPIFLIWVLTLLFIKKDFKVGGRVVLSILLGFALSAFFLLPALLEKQYAHLESLLGGYFDYRQHFVNINELFVSNFFGYGSSVLGPNDEVALSVGIIHWPLAALGLILSILLFKKNKKLSIIFWMLTLVELVVLFMMHQKSSLIWEKIPVLWYMQFPWRLLINSTFIISILGAGGIYLLTQFNKKLAYIFGVGTIVLLIILHGNFFMPKDWFYINDSDKFSGVSWEKQLTISIFDYLPIYAKFPPNKKAPELPEVLDGEVTFSDYQKGSNFQKGNFIAQVDSVIRLPLFDFPGMQVKVDGKLINHTNNDCRGEDYCFGLITINVPSGPHSLSAKLTDTPVRLLGNIITLVSFLVFGWMVFKKDEKVS